MGILHGLERRLQGAVDKTFARIFGGSVQPAEVTSALQHEAAARVTHQSGRPVAPNRYLVELGPSDAADVGDDLRRVSAAFTAMLGSYVREQGWDTYADVAVTLEESPRLHTGQFRVSSLIDPGVGGQVSPARYDAAPAAPPSAYPPQSDHGQPRYGQPQYGQPQPHYGAPAYPPGPSYPAPSYPGQVYPGQAYPEQAYPAPAYPPPASPAQPHPAPSYQHEPYQPAHYPAGQPEPDPAPRLIAEDGTGRSMQLHRGSNIVGRGQGAALRLADTSVSREHIDVYFDGRVAIVHDLGSTNGTSVNGSPIQTWQLADGDVIRVGQSTVVYAAR